MDLIQDLDMILPFIKAILERDDWDLRICVTDWLINKSPRVKHSLDALDVNYELLFRKGIKIGFQPRLRGIDALITAAESTLGPHRCAHIITKRANKSGIPTYTLQHGFENIGLTYFDEIQTPQLVNFAAQTIFTWGDTRLLSPQALPETVKRCLPVGCVKEVIRDVPHLKIPGNRDYLVGVFENLHWHRYSDYYRQRFLQDVVETAIYFPHITFLVKPHHAGKWLTERYQGKIPEAENLVIADPNDTQWEAYTAAALISCADGVITTPSTVAVDAVRAHCPVAVIGYDLELTNYQPLEVIQSNDDWKSFVKQLLSKEDRLKVWEQSKAFLEKNIVANNTMELILDRIRQDVAITSVG